MPVARPRPRGRRPVLEELRHGSDAPAAKAAAGDPARAKQMPAYLGGQDSAPSVPLLSQGREAESPTAAQTYGEEAAPEESKAGEVASLSDAATAEGAEGEGAEGLPAVESVAPISGESEPEEEVEDYARSRRLTGRTTARFRSSFTTTDGFMEPATGCRGCNRRNPCVRATGTLVSTFVVTTRVRLPQVPRGLTPCQRERMQDAITNVIAPHEQMHVDAFNTFNDTISTPFDMTICRNSLTSRLRAMHNAMHNQRRAGARALSRSLDPFHVDVDMNCDDTAALDPQHMDAGAQNPDEMA